MLVMLKILMLLLSASASKTGLSLVRSIVVTSISTECLSRVRCRFKWPCDTKRRWRLQNSVPIKIIISQKAATASWGWAVAAGTSSTHEGQACTWGRLAEGLLLVILLSYPLSESALSERLANRASPPRFWATVIRFGSCHPSQSRGRHGRGWRGQARNPPFCPHP